MDKKLLFSANLFGVELHDIAKGRPFEHNLCKLEYYIEFLKSRKEKFALCTDSRDVFYFDNIDNIVKTFVDEFYSKGHKLVFNAETNCYPDETLRDRYPNKDKKYKYLNSGCCIGDRKYTIQMFEKARKLKKKFVTEFSDQERIHHIFLDQMKRGDESLYLDYDCKIFQCLWDEDGGRSANFDMIYTDYCIYNQHTKTYPHIFHYPGPTGHASPVYRALQVIEQQTFETKASNFINFS